MSEESTTPDLVELVNRLREALNRRDFDAATSFYASDATLTLTAMGTSYEGAAAIRRFQGDFAATFAEYEIDVEEFLDLGHGVTFGVFRQQGRPIASSGRVQMRFASVAIWTNGVIEREMRDVSIDEARAVAERLAESRG